MTGANPLAAIAQQVLGGQQTSPGGDDNGVGQQLSQSLSAMRSTNPQMVLDILKMLKQHTAALVPHTADTIPAVARHLASNLRGLDSAMEAATKALMAQSVSQGPIGMSAISPGAGGQF